MSWDINHLRFCAYCPNPCRSAVTDDAQAYRESQTPSALALLAVLVQDGHVDWDDQVKTALGDTGVAAKCRPACPYQYDIAREVESFAAEREAPK